MTIEKFYINGWEEGRGYFRSVGHFTEQEWERMLNGETIVKNGNEFQIRIIERW